ncbi:hypothetical protein MMC07_000034 [Pseudocyphellaria aurata]|nr:hypothetical protein [Pseudocyphellaria aurata]
MAFHEVLPDGSLVKPEDQIHVGAAKRPSSQDRRSSCKRCWPKIPQHNTHRVWSDIRLFRDGADLGTLAKIRDDYAAWADHLDGWAASAGQPRRARRAPTGSGLRWANGAFNRVLADGSLEKLDDQIHVDPANRPSSQEFGQLFFSTTEPSGHRAIHRCKAPQVLDQEMLAENPAAQHSHRVWSDIRLVRNGADLGTLTTIRDDYAAWEDHLDE